MGHAKKKEEIDMVSPAVTPAEAPRKRKSARALLIEKFMGFVDNASKEMTEEELAAAEKKTDAFIARVRASHRENK